MKPCALLLAGVVVLLNASIARAERWENTRHGSDIDVDSIRRAADGLVYYIQRSRDGFKSRYAFDCKKGVSYYRVTGPDWKSKGNSIKPGTMGAELMKFVCSRVR